MLSKFSNQWALHRGFRNSGRSSRQLGPQHYLALVLAFTLSVAALSLWRVRGDGVHHIAYWFCAIAFVATVIDRKRGLAVTVVLLAVGPAFHLQLNALLGLNLKASVYPGTDACVGFLAGVLFSPDRRGLFSFTLGRFPSIPLILLHAWVVLSSAVAITRNLWQSASEFSFRGLWYNVVLVRGISWHDDYFPLQDLFFLSLALLLLFVAWELLIRHGRPLFRLVVVSLLLGVASNAAFAIWQKWSNLGWIHDPVADSVNAFFPDLHSFAGLMAIGILFGLGVIRTKFPSSRGISLAVVVLALASVGLYLSSSRSTLFFVLLAIAGLALATLITSRGWRRVAGLSMIVLVAAASHAVLSHGYRGLSYETLRTLMRDFGREDVGIALSHRPEIWLAAFHMSSEFPFFGLGQGEFYRLSSIFEFSKSEFLSNWGGENAHNYFLQTAAELGPIGVGLILLGLLPLFRVGFRNRDVAAFWGLVGVALGNIYAHALLIREMLMLSMVLLALYYWEVEASDSRIVRPLNESARVASELVLALLLVLSAIEVTNSFRRFPFEFAQRCHEPKPLIGDDWIGGSFRKQIPYWARTIEIRLAFERPDIERRPVWVDVLVIKADGTVSEQRRILATKSDQPESLSLRVPGAGESGLLLSILTSSCFVPLNLGLSYDPRRLGVRVETLRFMDPSGSSVPVP